jgi:hypothetical protein
MAIQTEIYGDYERYLQASSDGELPFDLIQFKHSLDWPIEGCISIGDIFGQYRTPTPSRSYIHNGIDIFGNANKAVIAPERLMFPHAPEDNTRKGLGDVIAQSVSMPVTYIFGHLNLASLTDIQGSEPIRMIEKEYPLGTIGMFGWNPRPEYNHLLFGEYRNHIHITVVYFGKETAAYNKPINPLLLFKVLDESA